jgi:hypothetical protein
MTAFPSERPAQYPPTRTRALWYLLRKEEGRRKKDRDKIAYISEPRHFGNLQRKEENEGSKKCVL